MRYRGFNISTCPDYGIERYNFESMKTEICEGFYCEIFAGDDDEYADQLDSFCLAVGYDIPNASHESMEAGIRKYVDGLMFGLRESREMSKGRRVFEKLGRAVCLIGEFESDEELYDTLKDQIGMTDDEIREIGFTSLVPFFNKECYAQTIAEYLIDTGTENTGSGNYHIGFDEINKRFGVSLPGDKELLDSIVDNLDRDIVSDIDTSEDFDLMFYLAYCPHAAQEDMDESLTQQM